MTKVRFTRSVTLDGVDYPMGSVHDMPKARLNALERSVELLEPVRDDEEVAEEHKDVMVTVDLLKVKPHTDQKSVNAPAVDKMVKAPARKKSK